MAKRQIKLAAAVTALAACILQCHTSGVPITPQHKTFGHSVKNGPLPAHTEVTTFEHNCTTAPCVITQIHVPSIYPPHNEPWNWTHGILNFYIDGDTEPTISLTLLELSGEGRFNDAQNTNNADGGPWGIAMMGRTAKSGGVYSTVRIPFGKSIKTTIQSPASSNGQSVYWMIVRGVEGLPVVLGDFILPPTARLHVHRVNQTMMENLQLITLASAPTGTSGVLVRVNFDAAGPSYTYLEACMRLVTDNATNPIFLSSGAEDYFLSASYFDEGMFKTPNSGLTYFDHHGTLGVYKTHDTDPVLFNNGMELIFRRSESTTGCGDMEHCPNQYCPPNQRGERKCDSYKYDQDQLDIDLERYNSDKYDLSSISTQDEPNYNEYFLGDPGATCTAACLKLNLHCNPAMNLGNITTMINHLNVSQCWKNGTDDGAVIGMKWYAPDQPGYIPLAINPSDGAKEPNYKECMGFVGYPAVSNCDAKYPTNARVCHCTATVPPTPPPPPAPPAQAVIYNTLVWTYEWETDSTIENTNTVSAALEVIVNYTQSIQVWLLTFNISR